ncbi:MAG TPA: amino acid adenylation domain-containing protein [Pyrinomonadaceae bacterium]|nr:amino acid adenylation domain-containing protein [Pyrinomonadaceae bacterium]
MQNSSELAARMAALSPEKLELLRAKLGERVRPAGTARLSHAQQRLWFAHQADPASAAYNMPFDIPFAGVLDETLVRRTLDELVRRHEGLRTVFPATADGTPVQRILAPAPTPLPVLDFSALPPAVRDAAARRSVETEARRPFNLATGPLFRATLVRLAREQKVLLCTLHHIICDGWSIAVLLEEFSAVYLALRAGRAHALPPVPVQYRDYAEWQRRQGAEVFAADLAYWRTQLSNLTPVEMPPDLLRRARAMSPPAAGLEFDWPDALAARIARFCKAEGVTPFMLLAAVFQWLLARYTERTDIAIGADIAGRSRLETERIVGYFVNQVVLRTELDPSWTFRELLARVRETVLDAYAHQELPFDRVVEDLAPRREAGRTPFFQTKLVVQNLPEARHDLEGLRASRWQLGNYSAKLDLTLAFRLNEQSMGGALEYAADLYSRARIESFLAHFQNLCAEAIAQPDRRLDEISLASAAEREQLIAWSTGARRDTRALCLHEMFAAQAARTPDADALVSDAARLTYAALEAESNRLASHLRTLGVGAEVRVGIYLPRTPAMFVAVLGVLKAGGAYVPLDTEHPPQRTADLCEDAQPAVILTDAAHEGALPSVWAHVVCLDRDAALFEHEAETATAPVVNVSPTNTAYVIYTSGSTGRPKGVAVSHAGVVNLALSQIEEFTLGRGKTVSQFAPLAFDASVYEWTMALLSGARLAVGSRENIAPGEPLADFLERHAVTTVTLPPSILSKMPAGRLVTVETLVVAGDACPPELVARWSVGRRMYNAYGPTETSVCATRTRPLAPHGRVTIGRPLRNLCAFLLDRNLRLVPVGVPGDLYVAGIGLAHGYLHRPAQTADAFLPNPFGREPGTRLYRTGDRGRWLPDGTIEFNGRADEQIKINGCRVEPGEINALLARHAGVREAFVVVAERNGHSTLIAYTTGEAREAELREYLARQLPTYMIPQRIVKLDALPLTPNGKIDRKALPAPDETQTETAGGYVPPRNSVEELLCRVWSEVLGREQVGIHDNFFELGGDSILSIQIGVRAAQHGLTLSTRDLFEHQTIAALSQSAALELAAGNDADAETSGDWPLTPIQRWFFAQQMQHPAHYNQAALLSDAESLDGERLQAAVEHVLAAHEVFRLRYEQSEGDVRQQYRARAEGEETTQRRCGRADLRSLPQTAQSKVIETIAERVQESLELETGRLVCAVRFEVTGGGRLLVVAHHLVIDGVSWRILLDQMERSYREGTHNDLRVQGSSFGQWARRLELEARSEETQRELAYWMKQQPRVDERVPRDFEAGANTVESSESVAVEFDAEQTEVLLREVPRRLRAQVEEVLMLGVVEALREWSGKREAVVEYEGHGREPLAGVDVSQTVGWFTTLFPVRFVRESEGEATIAERLREVRDQLRAVPRKGLGYGLLKYVGGGGELQGASAEVSFNYLGQWDANLGGLFRGGAENQGASQWGGERRSHVIDIHGSVHGGRLRMVWTYSRDVHRRETVERVAGLFRQTVEAVVAACTDKRSAPSVADFPLAKLDEKRLQGVLARLGQRRQRAN